LSLLIGVAGKARGGKDTLATELLKVLPGSQRYSLANALKCYCRVIGLMKEKSGPILQMVGTDLYRKNIDNDFWVKMLGYQIHEENPKIAIIADVRFPNEVKWIEDNGGICIKVTRWVDTIGGERYYADDRPKDHPSETALDDYGFFEYSLDAVSGDLAIFANYAQFIKRKIGV
jgi:hypothetical protein